MPRKPKPAGECPIDKYQEWLNHLANASEERVVLVEHKKEAEVLKALGVRNVIYYQKPEQDLIDAIADMKKECILLLDADRPSNKECERLKTLLNQNGVKTNTRFRKVLLTSQFKELSGLLKYLHTHVADTPRKHEGVSY